MRVLLCVFLFVNIKTGEGRDYDEYEALARFRNKPDLYPPNVQEPVPFGHITAAGFGDPFSPRRPPDDGIELSLRGPKNKQEALEKLKTARASQIIFSNPDIQRYYSRLNPKEEMLIERYNNPQPVANETQLKWYDLAMIQTRNAMRPSNTQYIAKKKVPARVPVGVPGEKSGHFPRNSFDLSMGMGDGRLPMNWTTCEQFAVGAIFAPKDIVNLKWTPFYVWDIRGMSYATEHTFEYPTSKLVNEYHLKYSKMVNKTIDWSRAKLLMKGIAETLLIAADKRGLFHAIVKHEIPDSATTFGISPSGWSTLHMIRGLASFLAKESALPYNVVMLPAFWALFPLIVIWTNFLTPSYNINLPSLTIRLKIADPYLVMTFCDEYFATVMAISGNEPTTVSEMIAEAATIKFMGTGRPVWRDYDRERESVKAKKDARKRAEDDKFIVIDEEIPPMGQWD